MMIRVITTIYPFPTNTGGKRRIVTVLEAFLRAGHRVELVVITKENEQLDRTELPENIDLAIFYQTNWTYLKNVLRSMWRFEPLQVSIYRDRRVSQLVEKQPVHTTVLHLIRSSWLRPSGNVILEMTDSLALNYSRRVLRLRKWLRNPVITSLYFLEFLLVRNYERKICNEFKKSILVSSLDAAYVNKKRLDSSTVAVIPLAINDVSKNKEMLSPEKNGIFFIGRLDYEPNEVAIRYFLEACFVKLLEQFPNIKLRVVGGGASPSLANIFLSFGEAIQHTDFVQDLSLITSKSFCSIAPMRSGAGMQNKILDAMNHSLPVVTTRLGYGAMNFKIGEEILIADSDQEFISTIGNLYEKPIESTRIGDSARQAVRRSFGFKKFSSSYLKECFDE